MTSQNTQAQVVQTQAVMTQAIVSVMALNVFAQTIAIMMAAAGMPPTIKKLKVTDPVVVALKEAYGSDIVSKAVEAVPGLDPVELARKVEELVYKDMEARYGEWAAKTAIQAAPLGDLRTAREIASTLAARGTTSSSPPAVIEAAASVGKRRGRAKAKPVIDSKTGIWYRSESGAAKAVAKEYGLDPGDHFAWYVIIKRDPSRFKLAT